MVVERLCQFNLVPVEDALHLWVVGGLPSSITGLGIKVVKLVALDHGPSILAFEQVVEFQVFFVVRQVIQPAFLRGTVLLGQHYLDLLLERVPSLVCLLCLFSV